MMEDKETTLLVLEEEEGGCCVVDEADRARMPRVVAMPRDAVLPPTEQYDFQSLRKLVVEYNECIDGVADGLGDEGKRRGEMG